MPGPREAKAQCCHVSSLPKPRGSIERQKGEAANSRMCASRLPINHICPLLDRTAVRPRLTRAIWCANAHVDASQPCYPTSPHNRPSSPLAPAPLLISGCRCCCWSSRSCLSSTCRPCAAISVAQQSKAWDKNIGSSPTRGGTQLIGMALEWQKSGYRCVRISSSLCPLPAARLLASCASLPCVGRRRSESTHIRFPSVRARDEAIQAEANWPR